MKHYLVEICIVKWKKYRVMAKSEKQAEIRAKKKLFSKPHKIGRKDIESPNAIEL